MRPACPCVVGLDCVIPESDWDSRAPIWQAHRRAKTFLGRGDIASDGTDGGTATTWHGPTLIFRGARPSPLLIGVDPDPDRTTLS